MASGGVRSLRGATPTWCALGTEARRGQGGGSSTPLPAVATLGPLRGRGFAQERITVGMAGRNSKHVSRRYPLKERAERPIVAHGPSPAGPAGSAHVAQRATQGPPAPGFS